jgi:hypothetical protein
LQRAVIDVWRGWRVAYRCRYQDLDIGFQVFGISWGFWIETCTWLIGLRKSYFLVPLLVIYAAALHSSLYIRVFLSRIPRVFVIFPSVVFAITFSTLPSFTSSQQA